MRQRNAYLRVGKHHKSRAVGSTELAAAPYISAADHALSVIYHGAYLLIAVAGSRVRLRLGFRLGRGVVVFGVVVLGASV